MDRSLEGVRKKLVGLMRIDPPFRLSRGGREGVILDRWVTTRLSGPEVLALERLEELYGEDALSELWSEVIYEAGVALGRA
jgi:hypothetical protein